MKKKYQISVKLLSPLHINGGTAADGTRVTVKSNGKTYIPATLFKGVMRGYFQTLINTFGKDPDLVKEFFGDSGFRKSHIILDNLETEQESSTEVRTNVSISRYTRKSIDGALVRSEVQPAFDANNEPVIFSGEMTVYYSDLKYFDYECFILKSIEMIKYIGSGKSRGLGFVDVKAGVEQF